MTQKLIRHHNRCSLQSRNIKRLRGCNCCHTDTTADFRNTRKRNILLSGSRKVTVDLIGKYNYMIFPAKLSNPLQCLPIPYIAHRIMGITQDHHGNLWIGKLLLQVLPVDGVSVSVICQRTFCYKTSIIDNGIKENIINRCLNQYLFSRCCQFSHGCGQSRDHTRTKDQPLFFNLQAVTTAPPVPVCLIPGIRQNRISKYSMSCSLFQRLFYRRRCLKIHIRHPHRKLSLRYIPLQRTGIPSVDFLIKIIHFTHSFPPLPF